MKPRSFYKLLLCGAIFSLAISATASAYYNTRFFGSTGTILWTWLNGSSTTPQAGFYGTVNVPSATNLPTNREAAAWWADASGNLWLFGGQAYDSQGNFGYMNDLWEYSGGEWVWVTGSNVINQNGTYGTKGTGATTNIPGGRATATGWIDSSGNFWIFGGYGLDSNGSLSYLNDLWEYTPGSSKWTWVSGSNVIGALGSYGTKGTGTTATTPGARSDMSSWVDNSGNFWLFGGWGVDSNGNTGDINDLWEYSSSKWTWISGAKTNSGVGTYGTKGTGATTNTPGARQDFSTWADSSGNLWLFGGLNNSSGLYNDTWEFTPSSKKWTWVSGASTTSANGTYGTKGTGAATNSPGARQAAVGFQDSSGNFWLFGGNGYDSAGTVGNLNDLWEFTSSSSKWNWVSGSNTALAYGTYGAQGVGSTSNAPGARAFPAAWVDSGGSFWFFGGNGNDSTFSNVYMNDLWNYAPSSGKWTWMDGPTANAQVANYGTQNVASATNMPGIRYLSLSWKDNSGNLWLFGGYGIDSNDQQNDLGDLWRYNPTSGLWTWMGGSTVGNVSGIYGTQGVGSASNFPGGRWGGSTWTDTSGNLWLFGGTGYDSGGNVGQLNDLWEYAPSSGKWTWMGGPNASNSTASYGTLGSGSTSNIPGPRYGGASWTDASGNFWLFGGYIIDSAQSSGPGNDLWKYTPGSGTWTWVSGSNLANKNGTYGTKSVANTSNIPGARYNSMSWIDNSGNLWIFGGAANDSAGNFGDINDLWKFNPTSAQWTWMSGGNIVGASGTFGTRGVANNTNVPGARASMTGWQDHGGAFWVFSGNVNGGYWNDLWKYTVATGQWAWMGGSNTVPDTAVYGIQGVASSSNIMDGRESPTAWSDGFGHVWIFGGTDAVGPRDDLWKMQYKVIP